jgi:tRNA(adenine34) deaminase
VVTLEPCLMCLGAMVHARVGRLVYGAPDARLGATALLAGAGAIPGGLNHRIEVRGGVREEECAALLREFFAGRRREGFVAASENAANRECGEVPKWS